MKLLAAVLVSAFAAISIAQGAKWVDLDPERAARVADYVACIGPCLQEAVTDPSNGLCQNVADSKKCLATVIPKYLPCVEKCTGRTLSQSAINTPGYLDDNGQEAFGQKYF
ncbi:hypothetical protein BGX30_005375 [Mortierella sp. GBA39]|nr:hypothetical protein BGX30_005375 [Mortierella sp. GBA39]